MTSKKNREPILCYFRLCSSFHSHRSNQSGIMVRKRLNWVLTCLTLTFCMSITFVNGNNSWKFHDDTMRHIWYQIFEIYQYSLIQEIWTDTYPLKRQWNENQNIEGWEPKCRNSIANAVDIRHLCSPCWPCCLCYESRYNHFKNRGELLA